MHTKEPWREAGVYLFGESEVEGAILARFYGGGGAEGLSEMERNANLKRARACVNACAGLNPEAIPEVVEALRELLEADRQGFDYDIVGVDESGISLNRLGMARRRAHAALAKLEAADAATD